MSIIYDPNKMLKKIAPEAKVKRVMRGRLSLKRTMLAFLDDVEYIDKKSVVDVALKTIKSYQQRVFKTALDDSREASKEERSEILDDPKLLINRVQNEIVFQISNEIKSTYSGEQYEWLPSESEEPDPLHSLNYGKVFTVGEGEMPGERYGCKCGMRILVNQTQLKLG